MSDLRLTCVVNADMSKITGRARDRIAAASTAAMREGARELKAKGRAAVSSGLSARMAHAFYAKVYPESGASLSPAIVAGLKIKYASVFQDGTTISRAKLLWLPLDSAPLGRGGKRITPKEYNETIGVLYFIEHPGKPPLLAAVVRETDARARKTPSLRLLKRGRNPGGKGSVRLVPLFVGVPSVTDPKRFDVNAIARDVAAGIGDAILNNLGRSDG